MSWNVETFGGTQCTGEDQSSVVGRIHLNLAKGRNFSSAMRIFSDANLSVLWVFMW